MRYGGNTPCVEVRGADGTVLVLDAGTGIRRLGMTLPPETKRVDILLTHLHMDHIQGLGFFNQILKPEVDVHIWGPASTTLDLRSRLSRYLSPPLFPVRLRDLPCELTLHDVVPIEGFSIGDLDVRTALVCHPGPTVGYRVSSEEGSVTYLPDHEPALGRQDLSGDPTWISGYDLCEGVDLLIHDAQYTTEEYREKVGWGHSTIPQAVEFATACGAKALIPFHHDPGHSDAMLDRTFEEIRNSNDLPFALLGGTEGSSFKLGAA
jgi:phosphoribosyl 1,2-cyclic phosphodiesterase